MLLVRALDPPSVHLEVGALPEELPQVVNNNRPLLHGTIERILERSQAKLEVCDVGLDV